MVHAGESMNVIALWRVAGWLSLKAALLCGLCLFFAYRVEKRLTAFFLRHERPPEPALAIFGIAITIAGLAAALGFSVAVGAFFAGLVFSRDPEALKSESAIEPLYEAFIPFFFLGLGFHLVPGQLAPALGPALILLVVAIVGKLIGVAIPGLPLLGRPSTETLAVSMVPRAEIAMAVVLSGFEMGAVPAHLYSAMVFVSAATCLMTPIVLRPLIDRAAGKLNE
jgi:Kef-type K+ transport system membrane component KefB